MQYRIPAAARALELGNPATNISITFDIFIRSRNLNIQTKSSGITFVASTDCFNNNLLYLPQNSEKIHEKTIQ